MTDRGGRVDFDDYADRYEELVKKQLAFFSEDRGYFSEYKVALATGHCRKPPKTILDFGCGIGLSLPFLTRYFPSASLFATDLSEKSLDYVRGKFPNVTALPEGAVDGCAFDMIFVSGVFHHVPAEQRPRVLERLATLLTDGGQVFVFEHNPYNPVTRHMVSTCPFDEDAELITLGAMKRLVGDVASLSITKAGYCLFFPQLLQGLRPIEKTLRWLPLGGQYFVVGQK
jgi:SAM-dependent methyltransferase